MGGGIAEKTPEGIVCSVLSGEYILVNESNSEKLFTRREKFDIMEETK